MRFILSAFLFVSLGSSPVLADTDEPIAYVGHGSFFDKDGRQIAVTTEFVARAQEWYRAKLLSGMDARKKAEFARFERRLNDGLRAEGQSLLVVRQRLLDWLAANMEPSRENDRIRGKLNALAYALQWRLGDANSRQPGPMEPFRLSPDLEPKLRLPISAPGGFQPLSATVNLGQAYINECLAAGVPIPPPIGQMDPAGVAGWKIEGTIRPEDQFIFSNLNPGPGFRRSPAEVRTFRSSSPSGMCVALPRYTDESKTTVALDGVICLGQTGKVCFWDNSMTRPDGTRPNFSFPAGTVIPIGVPNPAVNPAGLYQAGGFELQGAAGGECTDCHAGHNPYIVHPNADLGGGVRMGDLNGPPLNLPTFAPTRYDPLAPASWPQNQLSHSPTLVPSACGGCHSAGGFDLGGRFPHLSSELNGAYCNTILAQAINRTMPPSSPGSQAGTTEVVAFQNWCGTPASAGPSNRGDPHLTTTNNINYDFQAAGEFTALRNSDTRFELQVRQTPVSTTFTPQANPHTGLASCVSLNTAVAARVGRHRVTYQPPPGGQVNAERLQLRINGRPATLRANGISLGGGNSIARTASGGGLDITAADGTRLLVTPNFWPSQGYWYLNIEVLNTPAREGTMGHIPASDWLPLAPDGTSFGPMPASLADRHTVLNQKFADVWRVTDTTSLFDYAPGTSTADFTDRNWPPPSGDPCRSAMSTRPPTQPMNRDVARRLCRDIKDKAAFENCVFDLVATNEPGIAKAYLLTLKQRETAAVPAPP